jgi:hypothetical protein
MQSICALLCHKIPNLQVSVCTIGSESPAAERVVLAEIVPGFRVNQAVEKGEEIGTHWRALGGTIWLDLRSKLTHVGTHDFVGDTIVRFT